MRRRTFVTAAAASALAAPAVRAQAWPAKEIRFLVPYPGGGIVDIVTRSVAEPMAEILGKPIVVEPKPGGNSILATEMAARAPADGYTWVMATISHVVVPHLQQAPFDPLKDFQGVALVAVANSVAVVNPELPVKSLAELAAYGKANPGKLNYLNPGNGSSIHLTGELLKVRAGFDMTSVAYRGLPPGIPDLIEGRLQVAFLSVPLCLSHIRAGKMRALAFVGDARHAELPDVPTFAEAGYGDAQVMSWYTIAVPAKTPPDVVARINAAAMQALAGESARKRLANASCEIPKPNTPADVQALWTRDFATYGKLVKDANITG